MQKSSGITLKLHKVSINDVFTMIWLLLWSIFMLYANKVFLASILSQYRRVLLAMIVSN